MADNVASSRDIKEIERKILDQVSVFSSHALWSCTLELEGTITANPRIWNSNELPRHALQGMYE